MTLEVGPHLTGLLFLGVAAWTVREWLLRERPGQGASIEALRPVPDTAPQVMMVRICRLVAERFDVPVADIRSESRRGAVVQARQIAMRLSRELTKESYPAIGRFFNRDHSTVMHAMTATEGMALNDLRQELAA